MVAFPNPDGIDIHAAQLADGNQLGDLWEAARAAGVRPGTIRVWMTRKKIEPVLPDSEAGPLFHLPTVIAASKVRPGRPTTAAS